MAYNKTAWKDREVQYPNRYTDGTGKEYEFTRAPGDVIEPGTTINAQKLNSMESGIESATTKADASATKTEVQAAQSKADSAQAKADSAYILAGTKQDALTISSATNSASTTQVANSLAVKTAMDRANSAFQSASNGKNVVAGAITGMGQGASSNDSFATLSAKIKNISADANANIRYVLSGQTFYQGGVKRTGTMPNRGGAATVTPSVSNQTKYAGYYSGNITIMGDTDLKASNIKKGINIFGIAGTFTEAPQIAHGNKISGRFANFIISGLTFTPVFVIIYVDEGIDKNIWTYYDKSQASPVFIAGNQGQWIIENINSSSYKGMYVRQGGFSLFVNTDSQKTLHWYAIG